MALVDTTTGELLSDLTPTEARDLTDAIRSNAESLWVLLKESHDRKAWKALGYESWRDYATTEFGMSQSRAYQLLDQARVVAELEAASSTNVEISEAAARDLKKHLSEATAAVRDATKDVTDEADKQRRAQEALDQLRKALVAQAKPAASETSEGEGTPDRAASSVPGDEGTVPSPSPSVPPVDPTLGYRATASRFKAQVRSSLLTLDPERVIETSDDHKAWADLAADLHAFASAIDQALAGPRLKAVK